MDGPGGLRTGQAEEEEAEAVEAVPPVAAGWADQAAPMAEKGRGGGEGGGGGGGVFFSARAASARRWPRGEGGKKKWAAIAEASDHALSACRGGPGTGVGVW